MGNEFRVVSVAVGNGAAAAAAAVGGNDQRQELGRRQIVDFESKPGNKWKFRRRTEIRRSRRFSGEQSTVRPRLVGWFFFFKSN